MIERFNFYDLYGYLIPGFIFLALLWLPFGLTDETLLELDWSSALLGLVFGYVVGHLIQGLAIAGFPSDKPRFPSDVLLDDDDKTFSPELQKRLVQRISQEFEIDVTNAGNPNPTILEKRRFDAFMLCRRRLIQKEVASYAEQFEGMYTLMRGVATACTFATGYYLGFLAQALCSGFINSHGHIFSWLALLLISAGLVLAFLSAFWDRGSGGALEVRREVARESDPRMPMKRSRVLTRKQKVQVLLFWIVPIVFFLIGTILDVETNEAFSSWAILLPLCITLALVAVRSYGAYHQFAQRFAATVYRDFCAS